MASHKLVPVYAATTEVLAVLYRSMLEEAGIDVFEELMEDDTFIGVRQRGLHSRLLVRADDVPRALDLVAAYTQEVDHGDLDAGKTAAEGDENG